MKYIGYFWLSSGIKQMCVFATVNAEYSAINELMPLMCFTMYFISYRIMETNAWFYIFALQGGGREVSEFLHWRGHVWDARQFWFSTR
jgi:uncharacterized membrane protein YjdF